MSGALTELSFAEPAVARCPFPAYERLRSEHSVYLDPKTGIYEVIGSGEIRKAAADTATFTCATTRQFGRDPELRVAMARLYEEEGFPSVPTLLNNDGEEHKRLRSLVDRAFTAPRIQALMPAIRGEVDRLMAACQERAEIEFIAEFAIPLPLNIIADQLGVSRDEHEAFKAGSDAMLSVSDPLTPREQMLDHVRAIVRMQQIVATRVEAVRRQPDETILGVVANLEAEGGQLPLGLMVNLFQSILVAGNETTTNALGSALQMLIADPALTGRLRGDLPLVRNFVEEALRLHAPLQGFYRSVTRDTRLGGVDIPAGSTVMLRWGAADRDPSQFDCPDEVKLDRKGITQHFTFGFGTHFCIGNQLARAEMRAAFEAIVTRWPNLRYADRAEPVEPIQHFFAHGPKRMYIRI